MNYRSVMHATANENGQEEITIEFEKTFLQWLFKRPATVKTYVVIGGFWHNKDTGKIVKYGKEYKFLNQTCFYSKSEFFE